MSHFWSLGLKATCLKWQRFYATNNKGEDQTADVKADLRFFFCSHVVYDRFSHDVAQFQEKNYIIYKWNFVSKSSVVIRNR